MTANLSTRRQTVNLNGRNNKMTFTKKKFRRLMGAFANSPLSYKPSDQVEPSANETGPRKRDR